MKKPAETDVSALSSSIIEILSSSLSNVDTDSLDESLSLLVSCISSNIELTVNQITFVIWFANNSITRFNRLIIR